VDDLTVGSQAVLDEVEKISLSASMMGQCRLVEERDHGLVQVERLECGKERDEPSEPRRSNIELVREIMSVILHPELGKLDGGPVRPDLTRRLDVDLEAEMVVLEPVPSTWRVRSAATASVSLLRFS
jgi:hypothetical protein